MEQSQQFRAVVEKHQEPKHPIRQNVDSYQVVNQPKPKPKPQPKVRTQPPQQPAVRNVQPPAELFSEDSTFEITAPKAMIFSNYLLNSGLVPSTFQNAGQVYMAIQVAISLGYKKYGDIIRTISNMYVYQNKVILYGDLPLALVKRSGKLDYIKEFFVDDSSQPISLANENLDKHPLAAICIVKRKDAEQEHEELLTRDDLEASGIVIKDNMFAGSKGRYDVWTQHPKVMWKRRCRARALRTVFPDVLLGTDMDIESGKEQVNYKQHEHKQYFEGI